MCKIDIEKEEGRKGRNYPQTCGGIGIEKEENRGIKKRK